MTLPPHLPPAFIEAIERTHLKGRDFDEMARKKSYDIKDGQVLRRLARTHGKVYVVREFIRSLIPENWVDYAEFRMKVCPRDNYTDYFIWRSHHSPEQVSIASLQVAVIDQSALICDIGANSGSFTLPLAAMAGPGSTVLAFEPNPLMAKRLAENVSLNGFSSRVQIHRVALSDQRGRATLHFVAKNYGEATLNTVDDATGEVIEVETALLGDFIDDSDPRMLVLKIDVEGHEDRVLGPYLLADPPRRLPDVILIETLHKANWSLDLVKLLKEKGYQALFASEGNTLFTR